MVTAEEHNELNRATLSKMIYGGRRLLPPAQLAGKFVRGNVERAEPIGKFYNIYPAIEVFDFSDERLGLSEPPGELALSDLSFLS